MNIISRQPRKLLNPKEAAEALFAKRSAPALAPRILEDSPKAVAVDNKTRRSILGLPFAKNDNTPSTIDHAVTAMVGVGVDPTEPSALPTKETEHQKVFRFVSERRYVDAAKIAARLINGGQIHGFFSSEEDKDVIGADQWLLEKLTTATSRPFASVETITPERAQAILARNIKNRKVKARNLAKLLTDISSNEWKFNGESIILAASGELNDGQHRNIAVLLTRLSIESIVAFGVVRETIATVDTGEARDDASRLHFHDIPNYTRVAAFVAMTYKIVNGRPATPSEKLAFVRQHHDDLQDAARVVGAIPKGASGASFGSAVLLLIKAGAHLDSLSDFMGEVRGNPAKRRKSPGAQLREAIISKSFRATGERQVFTIIDLYIKWANGKSVNDVEIIHHMPPGFPLEAFR
ncbi:hypothetical protein [Rhizobium sp. P007]|uniref:hypothetical protein n=1 Tax=Rhizobium sp. P007 TaxID=285908 RepID=UPI001158F5D6|nr:hypothetical protein [Rhizobium sp. P007]CAD7033872.1 hypothetical protein RP007_04174 [Rhizobium sp. P007]